MSGPGIRYYHFAQELARSFEVTLVARFDDGVDVQGVTRRHPLPPADLTKLACEHDVVVAQYLPAAVMRRLARSDTRVIYDLYVPIVPEGLGWLDGLAHPASENVLGWRLSDVHQRLALATGDAFICASERQRDYYLGVLAAIGRLDRARFAHDPDLRDFVDVVPFGLPADDPPTDVARIDGVVPGDHVLLWAGGIWNWLDPLTPIRAVARMQRPDVKLVFLGRKHPDLSSMAMAERAETLARELGVLGETVLFHDGWIPYRERGRYLRAASAGVSAHFNSVETRFAFRTRLLDYFWAGLPTVTTEGDVLAELVEQEELGQTVPPGDVDAWVGAVEAVLGPEERAQIEERLVPVRERFAWPRVVEPLARLAAIDSAKAEAATWALDAERLVLRARMSVAQRGLLGTARAALSKLGR